MKQPTKIDGWQGAGDKLYPDVFEARQSLAEEELNELMQRASGDLQISSDALKSWLDENWDLLEALQYARQTGFDPETKDED